MNKLLTIVIPTYNMQAYLHRCLGSLILEDEKLMERFEVLVINDGSKDNSSAIAHEYEATYPNTFRVIDKENGNYGSCINRGLKKATGKYIKVLDADDWFDTDEFSSYINELCKLEADMILTDYQIVDESGKMIKKMVYNDIVPCKSFAFQEYTNPGVYFAMHSITYRTEMLRKIGYRQTEGISYTDTEWVYYPQHGVKTCIYLPFDVYRYVVGREGQTMDSKVLLKSAYHYDKLLRAMVLFGNSLSEEDKKLYTYQRLEAQITHLSTGVYRTCLVLQDTDNYDEEIIKSFDEFMRQERPYVYKEAGKLILKKFLPIHYVRYWRITGKRFSVDWIRDTYRRIRYGKN